MSVRLPAPLPWRFGDFRPPPALARVAGTAMRWTESIADRAEGRVIDYLRKPRIVAVLRALVGAGIQDVHDAAYQMIVSRWIDTSLGAQLDRIGWLLDQPRSGWPDETYRLILRAQVLTMRSDGTASALLAIIRAIGGTLQGVQIRDDGIAAASIRLVDDFDAGNVPARFVAALLFRAKPAGVRLLIEHPASVVDHAFAMSTSAEPERDVARGCGDASAAAIGGAMSGVQPSTITET